MGKSHCICGEDPCVCFNGWGRHFKTEGQLLAAIDSEIVATLAREGRGDPLASELEAEWEPGGDVDEGEVIALSEEGYLARDIAMLMGVELPEVRYILREKRKRQRAREKLQAQRRKEAKRRRAEKATRG